MLDNLKNYHILLVSGSPRRKQLLEALGLDFAVGHSDADESFPARLTKEEIPMYLSRRKADHAVPAMTDRSLIIAADTIVWLEGKALGKPSTDEEAMAMLRSLSGRNHEVITGVTVRTKQETRTFNVSTEVCFASLTDEEIASYVHRFSPLDKAGAYGIQEWIGMIGVREIHGSFYNVMGLPVHRLYTELKTLSPCC